MQGLKLLLGLESKGVSSTRLLGNLLSSIILLTSSLSNKFGLLEPIKTKPKSPNVILVPILAFDSNKYRLGYGKGFYDRYLKKYLNTFKNILTVGVAFSFQKHHKLPIDKHDIKLNYILTEKGIH